MDVVSFYQRMINPPRPWKVSRVEMSEGVRRVDVWLEHAPGVAFPCPRCNHTLPVYDHTPERSWRHLDTCDYETWLHARLPRVACSYDGTVQVTPPLSDPHGRLTQAMERRCIDVLKECSRDGSAKLTGLSWDEADAVMQRAVKRGMERREPELPEWMGIDEKSVFARHKYFTIITDLKHGRVIDVIDKRTIKAVEPWFVTQSEHLADVKGVAMDMSAGYANVVTRLMKNAEVCFDHFHVTMKVNQAVDEVRKLEQRAMEAGDARTEFFRSRFLFLWNEENVPAQRNEEFQNLKTIAVKTSRAWAIKENFRELWHCTTLEDAVAFFKKWYWWATHSRLEPMRRAAHTIKNHWQGIASAIVNKISNACTEGLNSKIERIKRDAYGFRNKESFRMAILFHCGDLSLYPS
jgi:transposase